MLAVNERRDPNRSACGVGRGFEAPSDSSTRAPERSQGERRSWGKGVWVGSRAPVLGALRSSDCAVYPWIGRIRDSKGSGRLRGAGARALPRQPRQPRRVQVLERSGCGWFRGGSSVRFARGKNHAEATMTKPHARGATRGEEGRISFSGSGAKTPEGPSEPQEAGPISGSPFECPIPTVIGHRGPRRFRGDSEDARANSEDARAGVPSRTNCSRPFLPSMSRR